MTGFRSVCLIALGSNLPFDGKDPQSTLTEALQELSRHGEMIRATSRFFETPCFPEGAGPDYVNAAAVLETTRDPRGVLALLHEVEARFGRAREQRWGMRTLDLDLIGYGDEVLPDRDTWARWHDLPPESQVRQAPDALILPHPRVQDRAFVLVPLADIARDWIHPALQRSVAQMCMDLPQADRDAVRPI
ncbi:2-amino-4-hydroxy-6-hydroxymethyldihydropteridine diphosphokinase [Lutimaribacter marinistellae]|uniref:2-amino-4-hydroxy-6-hydroxymethyldihydropteridine pyrophosphokinase n=1 Tax=Lutimaribacter marinistellae TaxID=1820329 RepID=A0ABV7TF17_9RHOB